MTILTNTTDRKALVKAIAEELHTEARYLRTPTYAYEIGDFTVDRYGNIIGDDFTPLMAFLLRNGYITEDALAAQAESAYAPAEEEAPTVDIDGRIYMGLLTMPTLGQEFPVIKGWSYDDMNIAPCQYSGTRAGRDLIICSHNYAGFFDSLEELRSGDEVIFTDLNGRKFTYEISYTELISGWDGNKMFAGAKNDWDMTLFTCTWSGYSRVTCRCVLKK